MSNSLNPDQARHYVGSKLFAVPYLVLTHILPMSFVLKMWSAFYVCCIHSNALKAIFIMAATTMNPDQTILLL